MFILVDQIDYTSDLPTTQAAAVCVKILNFLWLFSVLDPKKEGLLPFRTRQSNNLQGVLFVELLCSRVQPRILVHKPMQFDRFLWWLHIRVICVTFYKKTKKHKRQKGAKKRKKATPKEKGRIKRKVKKNSEVLASCLVLMLRYCCLLN